MSYSFYVKMAETPVFDVMIRALQLPDIRCSELNDASKATDKFADLKNSTVALWPEALLHFYRLKISTRGVEISREIDTILVRINSLASPEDYELALRFVEVFTLESKQAVEDEDGRIVSSDQLRFVYSSDWINEQNGAGTNALIAMLKKEGNSTVTLPGVRRDFHVGRRLIKELSDAGPDSELTARLIQRMREVQFIDTDYWYPAAVLEVVEPGTKRKFTASVWGAGGNYVFGDVDKLLITLGDEVLFVPIETIPQVAPGKCRFLDEKQLLVEKFTNDEWTAVVDRARKCQQVELSSSVKSGQSKDTQNPWWKFWR